MKNKSTKEVKMIKAEKIENIRVKYSELINNINYEIFEIKEWVKQGFDPMTINIMIGEKYDLIDKLRVRREREIILV